MSAFPVSLHCFPEQVRSCHLLSQIKPSLSILPRVETLGSGVSQLSMEDAAGIRRFWSFLGPSSLSLWYRCSGEDPRETGGFRTTGLFSDSWSPWQPLSSQYCYLRRGWRRSWGTTCPTCARGAEQQCNRTAQAGT